MNSIIVLLFIQNISKFFLLEVFLQSIVPRHSFGTKKIFFHFLQIFSSKSSDFNRAIFFVCILILCFFRSVLVRKPFFWVHYEWSAYNTIYHRNGRILLSSHTEVLGLRQSFFRGEWTRAEALRTSAWEDKILPPSSKKIRNEEEINS